MTKEHCKICGRPSWDGGHALNTKECEKSGGEACSLYYALLRALEGLYSIRKIESRWREKLITTEERSALIERAIAHGLDSKLYGKTPKPN